MDGSVQNRRIGPPRPGIAERIWDAARTEFSKRGYHGARVQGIARGASPVMTFDNVGQAQFRASPFTGKRYQMIPRRNGRIIRLRPEKPPSSKW